ncbi:ABC transporter ATP-binding protein [Janibacter sp. CX7]|uniref:ABC transporter ATP-binding protein n=1 Tax=Janibacter sp. CX7 TaxID=2963431 RepID=UPI0020CC98CE|nr:ABC transporter ATP-binding protein [Janibacter sp. CX7]UTT66528.1 ABC transporter ATP-binding protein [Janibacter sp. CX7]
MTEIQLRGLTKVFGDATAVDDIDLAVSSGESVVLLGPSGCGKTTTLRMIAGFERPTSGTISIGGSVVVGDGTFVPPEKRHVGMVFQSYALWPHMTVAENVAFGLTTRRPRVRKQDVRERADQAMATVQLEGLGDRYPHELSGGQQQRVSLARALVTRPGVLLMDEPLSNLDSRLREDMRRMIRTLQQDLGITMVYITHDRTEALGLADRVVSLRSGRVQQVAPPAEIYNRPTTGFVARALGPANLVPGTRTPEGTEVRLVTGQTVSASGLQGVGDAVACIRPHDIELTPAEDASGVITDVAYFGDETHYRVALDDWDGVIDAHDRGVEQHSVGDRVRVHADARRLSFVDAA